MKWKRLPSRNLYKLKERIFASVSYEIHAPYVFWNTGIKCYIAGAYFALTATDRVTCKVSV
jgi:hypothetical protein